MKLAQVRKLALALPEAMEAPHFDMTSFRVGGKIFATAPADGQHLHLFVDEPDIKAAVADDPSAFEELWWGQKLRGLRVRLADAPADIVGELLDEAWRRKATKRLLAVRSLD